MSPSAVSVVLSGEVVPYVRMTRRGLHRAYIVKNGKPVRNPAQRYLASQDDLKYAIKQQLLAKGHQADALPLFKNGQPIQVMLTVCVSRRLHTKDLDNQVKAILDAAQGLIFENDLWIDRISAERSLGEEDLVELVVVPAKVQGSP